MSAPLSPPATQTAIEARPRHPANDTAEARRLGGGLLLRIAKGLCPSRGQGGGSRGSALRLCARRLKPLPLLPPDFASQAGLQMNLHQPFYVRTFVGAPETTDIPSAFVLL